MFATVEEMLYSYKKIIAWGAGTFFERYHDLFNVNISYIVDKDPQKWGKILYGISIFSPEQLKEENEKDCLVIIFANAYQEIMRAIDSIGDFESVDIKILLLISKAPGIEKTIRPSELNCPILTCAGAEALLSENGSNKFIRSQIEVMYYNGYESIEITPITHIRKETERNSMIAIFQGLRIVALSKLCDFVDLFTRFEGMIIHSLYREQEVLQPLLSGVQIRTIILYYLHDFQCICKQRFLYFAGKPCLNICGKLVCEACSNKTEQKYQIEFHDTLFKKKDVLLVAPSGFVKEIVRKYYKEYDIAVLPHLIYQTRTFVRSPRRKIKIAFIGTACQVKGWDEYVKLVETLYPMYDFFCVGMCNEAIRHKNIEYIEVSYLKKNERPTMTEALRENEIDICFVGSVVPETFSYTYYEASEAGCFILTYLASGNINRQVQHNKNGIVFDNTTKMIEWLQDKEDVQKKLYSKQLMMTDVKANPKFIEYLKKRRIEGD